MTAWIGAAGAALFVAVFLLDGATRPGYSATRHTVSALALGPRGWLQRANFVGGGGAITTGAVGMLLADGHRMLALALAILGVGLVISVVPMDPVRGYPPGTAEGDPSEFSAADRIHDGAGALVFFAFPVIAVISAFALPGLLAKVTAVLLALALMAGLAAFTRAWEEDSPTTGVAQRAVLIPGLLWVAMIFLASS